MAYTSYPHPTNINGHGDNTKPIMPQLDGSEIEWVDDMVSDRTQSGVAKTRSMYPSKKRSFVVVHEFNSSVYADYEAFYDTYRKLSFSFTWGGTGTSFTCRWAGAPKFNWSGNFIRVTARLLQV